MKFFIKKSKDDQFFFVILAKNGEPIATSETYKTRAKAKKTIALFNPWPYQVFDETKPVKKAK